MPPAHGALLVALILGDDQLCSQWSAELDEVRDRINAMRRVLTERIQQNDGGLDFSHIQQQRGMFSFLGISTEQVDRLREQYGIYIVSSTRVNLAGINTTNIDYLAESMRAVLA
jgi:aspartate aminotransferase